LRLACTHALVGADPTPLVTVAIDRRNVARELEAIADLAVRVNAELIVIGVFGLVAYGLSLTSLDYLMRSLYML
jgi:hypothetical protein